LTVRNESGFQFPNPVYELACFSEKLFQLKEDMQKPLSQIGENMDLK